MKARIAAASSAKKMRRMSMKNCNKTKRVRERERESRTRWMSVRKSTCQSLKITFWLRPLHLALTMHEAKRQIEGHFALSAFCFKHDRPKTDIQNNRDTCTQTRSVAELRFGFVSRLTKRRRHLFSRMAPQQPRKPRRKSMPPMPRMM